jgi:sulfite reductase alpha subunit-like flavoprotein
VLEERGAQRLLARGEGDAGGAEFFEAFDAYETELWKTLVGAYGTTRSEAAGLQMKLVDAPCGRASPAGYRARHSGREPTAEPRWSRQALHRVCVARGHEQQGLRLLGHVSRFSAGRPWVLT